jgi:hypothetical protein
MSAGLRLQEHRIRKNACQSYDDYSIVAVLPAGMCRRIGPASTSDWFERAPFAHLVMAVRRTWSMASSAQRSSVSARKRDVLSGR